MAQHVSDEAVVAAEGEVETSVEPAVEEELRGLVLLEEERTQGRGERESVEA